MQPGPVCVPSIWWCERCATGGRHARFFRARANSRLRKLSERVTSLTLDSLPRMTAAIVHPLHFKEIVPAGKFPRALESDTPYPARPVPTCLKAPEQPHFAEVEPDLPQSALAVVLEQGAFSSHRREDETPGVLACGAQLGLSDDTSLPINESHHLIPLGTRSGLLGPPTHCTPQPGPESAIPITKRNARTRDRGHRLKSERRAHWAPETRPRRSGN